MVLIVATAAGKDDPRDAKSGRYQLITYKDTIAVYYDSRQAPPEASVVERAKHVTTALEDDVQSPFFLTPADGILDLTPNENPPSAHDEPGVFEVLMNDIATRVAARENVTIVNRGADAEKFLEKILRTLQKTVERSAENAMLIVADEIAKEKQMQRLLQLENETTVHQMKDAAQAVGEGDKNIKASISISSRLKRNLRKLREEHNVLSGSWKKGSERFTLLTAAHRGELIPPCTSGSCLAMQAFPDAMPMPISLESPLSRQTRESMTRSTYHSVRMRRRSTLTALEMLEDASGKEPVEPLMGNGWLGGFKYFVFNGKNSILSLPGVPKFEDLIKSFKLDFWFRKDSGESSSKCTLVHISDGQRVDVGQLFEISWNSSEDGSGSIGIYIRDGTNRVLECILPLGPIIASGDAQSFHHFMLSVQSLEEGKLSCTFDGVHVELVTVQQENPMFFNSWNHKLQIGAYLDENNEPVNVFCGAICEVRFGIPSSDGYVPVVRWPLMVCEGKLQEMTKNIPQNHYELLTSLEQEEGKPPSCAPHLDGNLVINMGSIGIFGELLYNWTVEIRFRTDVNNRIMSLMDGQWHTLVWKCVDSEANAYGVKVDGVAQELFYVVREGPGRFLPFVDWICLGGHNIRGYKVIRPFYGEISRCIISCRGAPVMTLQMNEGPGAYVLQDSTGNRNHGLLINPNTNAIRRHNVFWFPHVEESDTEGQDAVGQDDVFIHKNNVVSLAAVVFTCEFNSSGVVREAPFNILSGESVELDVVERHICDLRPEWKTWRTLPEACFRQVENLVQVEQIINCALSNERPVGHFMFVIRIGDCHVTLLNLHGPVLPPDATFNTSMLKWQYAYAVAGTKGRREIMLNHMISGVESVLLCDTLKPFTTAKLGPLNAGGKSIVTEDMIQTLKNNGKPWLLCAVLHNLLLNAEFGSSLHIIHHLPNRVTADEAASISVFNKRLYMATMEKAVLMVQRNWRARQGRMRAAELFEERQARDKRAEEIAVLRLNPAVRAKENLVALLVTFHEPKSGAIPPINNGVNRLSEILQLQGYVVTHLPNPDRKVFASTLSELDPDASSFVYISGYGGKVNIRQPPLISMQRLYLSISEGNHRLGIELQCGLVFRNIVHDFRSTIPPPKTRKVKSKGGQAGRRTKSIPLNKKTTQEMEMAARQQEELYRLAVVEIEGKEVDMRVMIEEDYNEEVLLIIQEIQTSIEVTREYERLYRKDPGGANVVVSCENTFVNPYASTVYLVDELLDTILERTTQSVGFQRVVAFDLEPITPLAHGFSCLVSSTGHTLEFPYKPQQRRILTDALCRAFDGRLPRVEAHSKYAVLHGGIDTPGEQRDWKSFATYVVSEMRSMLDPELRSKLGCELEREMPFVTELVPIRKNIFDSETRDRMRRDRDTKEINIVMRYLVGSSHIQPDMFSMFKNIAATAGVLKEVTFKRTIYVVLARSNANIDSLVIEALAIEINKCKPAECNFGTTITITAAGVRVSFDSADPADKLLVSQWINSIIIRSLTWQLPMESIFGRYTLEVDHVAYLYELKAKCSLRRFHRLQKQQHNEPIPIPYVRFLECESLTPL
uniref:Uncharacterized protein n=1 Tax=Trypanosoma vivax (strain Y486) TaxID=1055687 RepID=G0U8P0_TRYVY|nr:conserved hypothetical protein [Trypanosoma vivax Y486]